MKLLRTLLISCGALVLVSCTRHLVPFVSVARFSAPVTPAFNLNTSNAIIYGRFGTASNFAFGNKLVLRLCREDSKRVYLIRCRDNDPVYAVAVEPGRYRVAGFLGTSPEHRPLAKCDFPKAGSFQVRSNSLTYLGDFSGYAKITGVTERWGVSGITNNFDATSEELRQEYPNPAAAQPFSVFDEKPYQAIAPNQDATGANFFNAYP